MSTTFHCPFCGAPITGPAPGATFACPYCRAKVMAPYGAEPASARAWGGGSGEDDPSQLFTNGVTNAAVTVDPQVGLIGVGVHAPHGKPPVLRAWDARGRRPLWDALSGQSWLERLELSQIAIRGRNVYVANRRQLLCLDLARGTQRWAASLSDTPVGGWLRSSRPGLAVADPFPQGQRGAILVPTIDHVLFSFDRDSGQALWQRPMGDGDVEVEAVTDLGACVVRHGGSYVKCDVVNPAYAKPIVSLGGDHWSTDLGLCRVGGRTVLTVAEDMGGEGDDDGLLCFDAVTGQRHFFDLVEDLEGDEVVPCAMGQRAFAATSSGELYVGPRGRATPAPVPNHTVIGLLAAGPTLVLLLKKAHGSPVRRVVGLDPTTLAFRFDAGECGSEPDDDFAQHMVTDGYSVVYVASPNDDEEQCELRSIDTTTGRRLWSRPCGEWLGHAFVGGQLVVWSRDKVEALAPPNGQVLATLA